MMDAMRPLQLRFRISNTLICYLNKNYLIGGGGRLQLDISSGLKRSKVTFNQGCSRHEAENRY